MNRFAKPQRVGKKKHVAFSGNDKECAKTLQQKVLILGSVVKFIVF